MIVVGCHNIVVVVIKTLYTNGCSFTWGDELSNRELRYSRLLSEKLQVNLIDDSMCGSSNDRILRTTFDFIRKHKDNSKDFFVVIQWSGILRREFYFNGWNKITPTMIGTNPYAECWYTLQSQRQDNQTFFNQVLLLQLWLEKYGFKYFMFRHDNGNTPQTIKDGTQREISDGYNTKYIDKEQLTEINMKTFPSYLSDELTFREYTLSNGGGLKPNKHPDEISHKVFSEYLYTMCKKSS